MSAIIQQMVQSIPQGAQGGVTTVSILTMLGAFLEKLHGPMATIGVIVGIIWVSLQIYLALEKRFFPRKPKNDDKE